MYQATNGDFYVLGGNTLYLVTAAGVFTALGVIGAGATPVSMADNGSVLILVDGTTHGYVIDLTAHTMNQINESGFYGADKVGYVDTYFVFNRPGTNQFYITLSNLIFSQTTSGPIQSGTITNGGANYKNGIFTNVALTGGMGSGAVSTITIAGGIVTTVAVTNPGSNYADGDVLGASISSAGVIATGAIGSPGEGYAAGTYTSIPLTGGSGAGAIATITVVSVGHKVSTVTLTSPGTGYSPGDILTASLPSFNILEPGNGFFWMVATIVTPGTGFSYTITISQSVVDSLDIASKTGYPDNIVTIGIIHRELWLIGRDTTEVWYNTGASDFTFGIMPGVYIQHGCIAKYSLAQQDLNLFWLSHDPQGKAIVVMSESYGAHRISTHAIESVIQEYSDVSDAIGFCYQQNGHVFYVLNFPTGNATWVYDNTTGLWHQRCTIDVDGNLNRALPNTFCFAFNFSLCADYANGNIYQYDIEAFTDNGLTVPRIRAFPHLQNEDKRVSYRAFIADMEVGNYPNILTSDPPLISLRWSDTRGASWNNAVEQSLGAGGQYLTSIQWARLGMARDRIFELSWSADVKTALNGAYIDAIPMGS